MKNAHLITALEAREAIDEGALTSLELITACLEHIDQLEDSIGAWAHIDRELALGQARQADEYRRRGVPTGALHGLPVGIKDIIDTSDYPTERGTVLHRGRTPAHDATLVGLLREAGAIILGKTVTTEMAVYAPGKTKNPHNTEHTPGGSSSGSAAAVASAMVPLAVGTQTNGSVIRPASFCGIYGFKPSFARISRHGVLTQSPPLDTVGVFARDLADLALIGDVLMRYDSRDRSMSPVAPACLSRIMAEEVPIAPHFAFIQTPKWEQVDESSKDGFRELIDSLNDQQATVDIVNLPSQFDDLHEHHQCIMEADLARYYAREYRDGKEKLSTVLCEMIERGQKVLATDYNAAISSLDDYNECLEDMYLEYDAIITPSSFGAAPKGLDQTGSPEMCTIWTMCGNPALNIPLLQSPEGLPVGVQLVGKKGEDGKLFRNAQWLLDTLNSAVEAE